MDSEFKMDKTFNPHDIEDKIYSTWEIKNAFRGIKKDGIIPFTIVMPPPNITGHLHMGHAMDSVLQDAPIRYNRMKGIPTLWVPGTDHASIATEVKVVEKLAREGINKSEIGREIFLEKAWEWKEEFGNKINQQQRKLGISCDWERERFTLDEGCSAAVKEAFVRLYEKGLIYHGNRMINWCPVCKTALSDAEVEFEELHSHLWYFKYPAELGNDSIIIATTRPETMLGDTGVAVNPNDKRYKHLVGKNLILPILGRVIPIIADEYVDMEFGTGAVKMTPAHDPNDFEIAKRHNLEIIRINNDDGSMNENAGEFSGLSLKECRKRIVEKMKELNLLVKIEDYKHNVGSCYRCSTTVEPIISKQWFVSMESLAKPAIEVVKSGETEFIPERFSKIYYNWMENIKDWCISRQLWWGHRIPAWHCNECGNIIVSRGEPTKCDKCNSENIQQDNDVLDTWFSSALWPFSTLGWPNKTDDLDYYYPTSMLVTGYDIIFFWVARMIFSGLEYMGKTPFKKVLIHGLVRDSEGKKMSKSLGNGIDPIEIINKYGADALRFSLVIGVSAGNDTRFSVEKVESARNFSNKVWNASRFVLMNVDKAYDINNNLLDLSDKWILSRLNLCIYEINNNMDSGEFGLAAQRVYDFIWSEFCDWYIELSKNKLFSDNDDVKDNTKAVLTYVLKASLKLLHPFMPFITEEIYQNIPGISGLIMLSNWPEKNNEYNFDKESKQLIEIMNIIRTIRNLRTDMNVANNKKIRIYLLPRNDWNNVLDKAKNYISGIINTQEVLIIDSVLSITDKTVSAISESCEIIIPLGDLVDFEKEHARLLKEREKTQLEIERAESKLSNKSFIEKAPKNLIDLETEKLAKYNDILIALNEKLEEILMQI